MSRYRSGAGQAAVHSTKILLALPVLALLPAGQAGADWIPSALDPRCEQSDIDGVSRGIREAIEASVRRAEATIDAPAPIADLSCLDDLMTTPLDIFSNIGGLMGTLQAGLFDSLPFSMDMDVSGMVCDFAAERWGELTGGLSGLDVDLSQFADTPSSMVDRLLGGGGFGSGGNSSGSTGGLNIGAGGTTRLGHWNVPTGSEYTGILPSDEVLGMPIFNQPPPEPPDGFVFLEQEYMAAMQAFDAERSTTLMDFITCEVVRRTTPIGETIGGVPIYSTVPCPSPDTVSPPDIDTFIVPAAAGTTTVNPTGAGGTSALSTPSTQSQRVSPGALIAPPQGPARRQPSGRNEREETIQSIWERL